MLVRAGAGGRLQFPLTIGLHVQENNTNVSHQRKPVSNWTHSIGECITSKTTYSKKSNVIDKIRRNSRHEHYGLLDTKRQVAPF